jgi:hypothetical protein
MSGAPKASDVPGRIKQLLREKIQSADLQKLTLKDLRPTSQTFGFCTQHIGVPIFSCREKFALAKANFLLQGDSCQSKNCAECAQGEALLVKYKILIRDTINDEVEARVREEAREQWTKRRETTIAWHENPDLQPPKRLDGPPTAVREKQSKQQLQAEARREKERLELEAQLQVKPKP